VNTRVLCWDGFSSAVWEMQANYSDSIPVKTVPDTAQYKDFAIQGRVAVAYGEDIKIATIHGKDLVVAVSKYAKPKK